jgi:hypothetical protein
VLSRAEGSRAPASAADRWSRFGALSGVLLAVAWAPMGLVVGVLPELDSAAEIDTFFSENGDLMKVVIACVGVGFFCFLSFLAALAQHLHVAESGGVLKWLALTSALMFMTLFNAAVGLDAAAGLLHETSTPEVTHGLHTAAFVLAAPAALVVSHSFLRWPPRRSTSGPSPGGWAGRVSSRRLPTCSPWEASSPRADHSTPAMVRLVGSLPRSSPGWSGSCSPLSGC